MMAAQQQHGDAAGASLRHAARVDELEVLAAAFGAWWSGARPVMAVGRAEAFEAFRAGWEHGFTAGEAAAAGGGAA